MLPRNDQDTSLIRTHDIIKLTNQDTIFPRYDWNVSPIKMSFWRVTVLLCCDTDYISHADTPTTAYLSQGRWRGWVGWDMLTCMSQAAYRVCLEASTLPSGLCCCMTPWPWDAPSRTAHTSVKHEQVCRDKVSHSHTRRERERGRELILTSVCNQGWSHSNS